MSMQIKKKKTPQILIYHTHAASEQFANSRANKDEDSIVGVGEELAQILTRKYGYHVIHDETKYDMVKGSIDRNKAYNQSGDGVKRLLQKYPDIQVIIDLHRDGVGNKVHRLTSIRGKRTAQVMFFNGLSRNQKGNIAYLHNDNLQANLAFSLQMKIACMKTYPGFAKPIYLKNYRYNLHMKQRSLLIELGNEKGMVAFCKGVQRGAPVDSFVVPEPWDMPGYESKVIMAAGAFHLGASIELSADGPIREPYAVWLQGGLTYFTGKTGILLAAQTMLEDGVLSLEN